MNNRPQRTRNTQTNNNSVCFRDHGNTELTAEITDAPRGSDSCHCGSGSKRRNGTEVSVTSSQSIPTRSGAGRLWEKGRMQPCLR